MFICRGSGGSGQSGGSDGGDIIDMVVHATGRSLIEACEFITGEARPDKSRDETSVQYEERQRQNEKRRADLREREDAERARLERMAQREEEHVASIIDRSVPIEGTHAETYMRIARGLTPARRLVGDLRFVERLAYWGQADNGSPQPVKLAEVPALIAIIRDFAGIVQGFSETYLDPREPRKWAPTGSPRNRATKTRGEKKHGLIRLGRVGETLAISEGWVNALSWHQLGRGPEDVSLAAAVDLGNMAGGSAGSTPHPFRQDADGRTRRMGNGQPDMKEDGAKLPVGVKSIILIADGDSDYCATAMKVHTAGQRWFNKGFAVEVDFSPRGKDWNDVLLSEQKVVPLRKAE